MTIRDARCLFTSLLARLLQQAELMGFEAALGEVVRDPLIAKRNADLGKGITNSLHLVGLAADINLYRDKIYLGASESHATLGAYWKSLHPLCRWGGDFKTKDGNHYSLSWEGRA